jgi:hypothetical protein
VKTVIAVSLLLASVYLASAYAEPPSTPNSFAGQIMTDGKLGRVGVGTTMPQATLDVYQGEVKIGSSGAACTKGLVGALRSAGNKLQFCDGAGWRNVSLDKAE